LQDPQTLCNGLNRGFFGICWPCRSPRLIWDCCREVGIRLR
jgi:hypothetical protein